MLDKRRAMRNTQYMAHTPAFTKPCRVCGTHFTVRAGAAGATVNCPDHRKRVAKPRIKTWPAIACGRCGKMHTTLKCDGCGF